MGNDLCRPCCGQAPPMKVYNILLLGLIDSGKTELGMKIMGKTRTDYSNTNGVQCYKKYLGNDLINITEVGGDREMRKIWHHYYVKAMGVIFTMDMSKPKDVQDNLIAFSEILLHKFMIGKPVVLVGTHNDRVKHLNIIDFNNTLRLEQMANFYQTHLFLTAIGQEDNKEILEFLIWLKQRIDVDYQGVLNRIKFDKEEASQRSFPVLRHGEHRTVRNTRMQLHKMRYSKRQNRPLSVPSVSCAQTGSQAITVFRSRNDRVVSAHMYPHYKRVRFQNSRETQV